MAEKEKSEFYPGHISTIYAPEKEEKEGEPRPGRIFEAMAQIMREVQPVPKRDVNREIGYQYRGIDSIYNGLHAIMAKHGVIMTSTILAEANNTRTTAKGNPIYWTRLTVRFRFIASDGSFVETQAVGDGMDTGDSSASKAMTAAQKTALIQTFLIETGEDSPAAPPARCNAPKPRAANPPAANAELAKKLKRTWTKWSWKSNSIRADLAQLLGHEVENVDALSEAEIKEALDKMREEANTNG